MLASKLLGATSGGIPRFISSSSQSVTGNSITVTAPSGILNGDLLVAIGTMDDAVTVSTYPSGFVEVARNTTNQSGFIAYKVASSESGNYTFTLATSNVFVVTILVYRNATRVNTVGNFVVGSASTFAAPSITPTLRGTLLAAFGKKEISTVSSAPSGMTQRVLTSTATTSNLAVYELSPQEAVATGTKSITWAAPQNGYGVQFQITNERNVEPEFVESASTQRTTSGTTLTINKPTGTVEGDLMVAVMSIPVTTTWTGDTGWTEVADQNSSPSVRVAYKVAGASEGSSYTFTSVASSTSSGTILTYRYASYDTIGTFTTNSNPLILPSVSTSQSQSVLLAIGARAAASITLGTPTGMTARVTDSDATSPSFIVCSQTVPNGATGTRSMTTGSSASVSGIMLSIKPTRSF